MSQAPTSDSRLPALDLLRFAAALAVTLYHFVSSYPVPADAARPGVAALSAVTRYGYLGVDLFFMISGFVILWSAMGRNATDFVIGRISRLYPSFWVSLVLSILWIALLAPSVPRLDAPPLDLTTILANATMLPAVFDATLIEDVYWTLEIEIRFYALIFLVLLFRQMPRVELCLHAWQALSIVAAFTNLPWIFEYVSLTPYASFFIAGAFFYLVYSRGLSVSRVIGLVIAGAMCVYVSIPQRANFITPDTVSGVVVPLLVLAFLCIFAFLASRKSRVRNPRLAYSLGALTYPLYLTHAMMGYLVYEILRPHLGVALTLVFITALAMAVAWAVTRIVDIPARKPVANLLYRCARSFGLTASARTSP